MPKTFPKYGMLSQINGTLDGRNQGFCNMLVSQYCDALCFSC